MFRVSLQPKHSPGSFHKCCYINQLDSTSGPPTTKMICHYNKNDGLRDIICKLYAPFNRMASFCKQPLLALDHSFLPDASKNLTKSSNLNMISPWNTARN